MMPARSTRSLVSWRITKCRPSVKPRSRTCTSPIRNSQVRTR
jgi:hypothetical protein